jgi:hypothetical protein
MELTHGFGKMENSVGQWKKNSGDGKLTETTSNKEKAFLTVVVLQIGLILFFVSCVGRLTSWYKKTQQEFNNRWNSNKNIDIIDVEYEVKNENE